MAHPTNIAVATVMGVALALLCCCVPVTAPDGPTPHGQSWRLIYDADGRSFALDTTTIDSSPLAPGSIDALPPVRVEHEGVAFQSTPHFPAVASPGGELVAHTVWDFDDTSVDTRGRRVAIETRSSNDLEVLADDGASSMSALAWFPDNFDLLLAVKRDANGELTTDIMVEHAVSGERRPFGDQRLQAIPRPCRLHDGRLLYCRAGRDNADRELVLLRPGATQPVVVRSDVGRVGKLHVTPRDAACWVVGHEAIQWIDLESGQVRREWHRDVLVDPAWRNTFVGDSVMRPDGAALAIDYFVAEDNVFRFGHGPPASRHLAIVERSGNSRRVRRIRAADRGPLLLRGFLRLGGELHPEH